MDKKKKEKCGLKDFFYHEYNVYMDLAKLSEENRDKYIRMYLIVIPALIGFASKLFYDIGSNGSYFLYVSNVSNNRFLITIIIILALIFSLSFIISMILYSGRKGKIDCMKRVNILRKYLVIMECKGIDQEKSKYKDINGILLPTTSDDAEYWDPKSVTGSLLITVLVVMIICFIFILSLSIYATISISYGYIIAIVSSSLIAPCLICKSINKICLLKEKDGYKKEKQDLCLICEVLNDICQLKGEDTDKNNELNESEESIKKIMKDLKCI